MNQNKRRRNIKESRQKLNNSIFSLSPDFVSFWEPEMKARPEKCADMSFEVVNNGTLSLPVAHLSWANFFLHPFNFPTL